MPPSPLKEIIFTVDGLPVSKGSLRPPRKGGGKLVAYRAKDLKSWQQLIAYAAKQAGWGSPCLGPIAVEVTFYLQRPACHYRDRDAGHLELHRDAPRWPCRKPHADLDKLERAIGDALQKVCYGDDVQICRWTVEKKYADWRTPGAVIRVATIGE